MLDTILKSEAVSFEGERLDVADLVLLGLITGAWPRFEREVSRGLALERDALGTHSTAELKARATRFATRDGCSARASSPPGWPRARLTVADLSGVLGRALLRERMPDGDCEVGVGELAGVLRAEALCGGIFETARGFGDRTDGRRAPARLPGQRGVGRAGRCDRG